MPFIHGAMLTQVIKKLNNDAGKFMELMGNGDTSETKAVISEGGHT